MDGEMELTRKVQQVNLILDARTQNRRTPRRTLMLISHPNEQEEMDL
jgi:hypothetical protein